jgi:integrase
MPRKRKLPDGLSIRGNQYYATIRYGQHGERKRIRKAAGKVKDGARTPTELFEAAKDELRRWQNHFANVTAGAVDNSMRVEDLVTAYLAHSEQHHRPSTHRDYKDDLDRVLGALGVVLVQDITVDNVGAYRKQRLGQLKQSYGKKRLKDKEAPKQTVSPRTVNKEIDTLHHLFNWGVDTGKMASNPIKGLKDLPVDVLRKERRALTPEEIAALFKHSRPQQLPVWRCFLSTGMRLSEVCEMRFAWVDFEAKEVTIPKHVAKTHKDRRVPLSVEVLADIKRLQAEAKDREPATCSCPNRSEQIAGRFSREHVFVTKYNTPIGNNLLARFYETCKRAGIQTHSEQGDVDIHSLRGCFATLAIDGGANPRAVQEVLGHSTLEMTMRIYARATDRGKRGAVDSLPFATAAQPQHVVSLDDGPKLAPAPESEAQAQGDKHVG